MMARETIADRNHIVAVHCVRWVTTQVSWSDGEEALVLNWPFMMVHARALNWCEWCRYQNSAVPHMVFDSPAHVEAGAVASCPENLWLKRPVILIQLQQQEEDAWCKYNGSLKKHFFFWIACDLLIKIMACKRCSVRKSKHNKLICDKWC